MTEDKMVRWHHQLNGHEFEQALGDGEGQGSLAYCILWGCKEKDMTEQLNNNKSFRASSSMSLPRKSVKRLAAFTSLSIDDILL